MLLPREEQGGARGEEEKLFFFNITTAIKCRSSIDDQGDDDMYPTDVMIEQHPDNPYLQYQLGNCNLSISIIIIIIIQLQLASTCVYQH